MCIYCGTNKYCKIYENHYGPIPKEENGRSYEIHHIDGNHSNNDPSNLTAITLQEHYDIHYSQRDYGACYLMAVQRMNKTPEEISELSSKAAKKRIENGTHNFCDTEHSTSVKKRQLQKIENKTHQWTGDKNPVYEQLKTKTHPFQKRQDGSSVTLDKVKNGTHPFLGGEIQRQSAKRMIENGTSSLYSINSYSWTCKICGKNGKHKANESRHAKKCERENLNN